MAYWLLKTEPDEYSFDDLERERDAEWDGVRNHQARNNLAAMRVDDECLIYHSGKSRSAVGIAIVQREAYPDPTAEDPRWLAVVLRATERLPRSVSLAEIRAEETLAEMALLKQSRLSVCPVSKKEWRTVLQLARNRPSRNPV